MIASAAGLPSRTRQVGEWPVALALFLAALFVYLANGRVLPGADAKASAYTPYSVLRFGETAFSPATAPFMFVWEVDDEQGRTQVMFGDVNERPEGRTRTYRELFAAGALHVVRPAYFLVPTLQRRAADGAPLFANTFGPVPGLLAVPVALALAPFGIDAATDSRAAWTVAKATAALLVAASVGLVYLAATALARRAVAVLLALTYGFATSVWAISSQTLWQQTPALFFLGLGAWALCRVDRTSLRGAVCGAAFAAAFACRPTALSVLAIAGLYFLAYERRALGAFIAAALPIVFAIAWYNVYYFGSPADFGQLAAGHDIALQKTGSPDLWQTPVWLGALGLLLSPSRGLLVYSPVLILGFAGAVLAWRDARYRVLRFLSVAMLLLWIPAFKWFDWWGGWSYGYRPIVDSVPFLTLLAVPALAWVLDRPAWRTAFIALLAWSVIVQAVGVLAYSPFAWNAKLLPGGQQADIDNPAYRYRLWSFADWQIGDLLVHFPARMRESRDFAAQWVGR